MSTATITATETDEILARMFTENTGRHMLDSGGAYGRNWERNQGKSVDDFLAAPEASWGHGNEYVTLDTFHFLRQRVDFDAELQARWVEFSSRDEFENDGWLTIMEEFAKEEGFGGPGEFSIVNTYNHDSSLDTVLQYLQCGQHEWVYPGDEGFVLLQIHGGCDVRGGYTAPVAFRVAGYDSYGLLDDNDFEVYCSGSVETSGQTEALPGFPDTPPVEVCHYYSNRGGDLEAGEVRQNEGWVENDDLSTDIFRYQGPTDDEGRPLCPNCNDGKSYLTPAPSPVG